MAHFDCVPEDLVPALHVPNSVPIIYKFDRRTRLPVSTKLGVAAGTSHARWLISAENHYKVREAIQPGGTLTRALFDAMDADGNRNLKAEEMLAGIRDLTKEDYENGINNVDCVVLALAKKIARELGPNEDISLEEFERRAENAYKGLEDPSDFAKMIDTLPFP